MGLVASDKGGTDFKVVPAGTHIAVCNMVVDLGVQGGGIYKPTQKVFIRWELPGEMIEWTDRDGKGHSGPMVIGREYTLSLSEKANLRADLEGWRGKVFTEQELQGFDVRTVVGKSCMLGVTHNTKGNKTYANISAVMGLPKGTPPVKPFNPMIVYTPDEHDQKVFESLPEWIQKKIDARIRDDKAPTVDSVGRTEEFDDDIPF